MIKPLLEQRRIFLTLLKLNVSLLYRSGGIKTLLPTSNGGFWEAFYGIFLYSLEFLTEICLAEGA